MTRALRILEGSPVGRREDAAIRNLVAQASGLI
jgi:hypothetical protein